MNMSNKLLLGLLLTILLFITVMLGTAKFYQEERKEQERNEVPHAPQFGTARAAGT